jgi:hypothetical protein
MTESLRKDKPMYVIALMSTCSRRTRMHSLGGITRLIGDYTPVTPAAVTLRKLFPCCGLHAAREGLPRIRANADARRMFGVHLHLATALRHCMQGALHPFIWVIRQGCRGPVRVVEKNMVSRSDVDTRPCVSTAIWWGCPSTWWECPDTRACDRLVR